MFIDIYSMERKKYTIQNRVTASHPRISHLAGSSAEFWEFIIPVDSSWQG